MRRWARWPGALLLAGLCACARVPGGVPIPVMGYSEPADTTAARTGGRPSPAATVAPLPEDSAAALAQRVAVLPFRDRSKYKGPWDIWAQLARGVGDSLQTHRLFRVVPMESVLPRLRGRELKGVIEPDRALQVGRDLGADLVVLGEIADLSMKRFRATVPLGGYLSYQGIVDLTLTVYKTIDGRPAGQVTGEGLADSKRYGITNPAASVPLDREYYLLGETPWGTPEFRQTLVGQATGDCLHKLASGLSDLIHPPAAADSVSLPTVIDVDGAQAYINSGVADGVRNGDKYGVWDNGRPLQDPQTGTTLGKALPRRVGVVQVEQVLNEHLSVVRILEGQGQIQKGFGIRAE